MLKTQELRNLSEQELREKLKDFKKTLFEMRTQAETGHVEKAARLRETRRDIARILTILGEKEK